MNVKEEKICRLCLEVVVKDFYLIDTITKEMFQVLPLRVNLDISKDPIVCKDCTEILIKCYDFKSAYGNKDLKTIDQNFICRFCSNHLMGNNFVLLDALTQDVTFAEMFQTLMPDMDFNVNKNPVICTSCRQDLECYFKFVRNCLDVEYKISKYCQNRGTLTSTQVKLSEVLQFSLRNVVKIDYTQIHTIKQEYDGKLIKDEEVLDIKDEEVNINKTANDDGFVRPLETQIFKCAVCTYETKQKCSLKRHMLTHRTITEGKMHQCPMCTFVTNHKGNLKMHTLNHKHITELETYKCTTCSYEAKRKGDLKSHILIHKDVTKVEMHKCPICDFQAKRKSNLTCHMLIHKNVTEVKMYNCSMCTFLAKHNSNLKTHMLLHRDVKELEMYKCPTCTFQTIRKGNLKTHVLIHKNVSEVEMYNCALCNFQAKLKCTLKRHMLVHQDVTEAEIYKCSLCNFETKHKYNLNAHIKKRICKFFKTCDNF